MSSPLLSSIDLVHEGTPHRVKDEEKAILYREICVGKHPTRQGLSRRLAIRPSSVSEAVQELVDDGLVREKQTRANGKTGRPESILSVRADRFVALSVYVDSRELKGVVVNLQEEILAEDVRVLSAEAGNKELAASILDLLKKLSLRVPSGCELVGACLALVGTVNVRTRTWVSVARWPKLRDLAISDIEARVSFPVILRRTNDAELDYYLDCTPSAREGTTLLLHWGFGIGSAVAFRGTLLTSTIGRFGEIGHAHMEAAADAPCLCGQVGCLESVAALWALLPALRLKLGHEVPEDEKDLAPILGEAKNLALPEVKRAFHAVQDALGVLYMVFYPDTILLSGPFTDNSGVFRRLAEGLRGSLPAYAREAVSLGVIPGGMPGCRRGGVNPLFREALSLALRRKT
jgi:predicted NBD/HSP70 family sugar kinase